MEVPDGDSAETFLSQAKMIQSFVIQGESGARFITDLPRVDGNKSSGLIFNGKMVSCTSPWDFHVVFADAWVIPKSKENTAWDSIPQPVDPIESKHKMTKLLSSYTLYLSRAFHNKELPVLKDDQLVTAFLPVTFDTRENTDSVRWQFYRAVVVPRPNDALPDFTVPIGSSDIYMHKNNPNWKLVYLLDEGQLVEIEVKWLRPLPAPFAQLPPMAIRCTLNGVSPVGQFWTKKATQFMRSALSGEELMVEFFNQSFKYSVRPYAWNPVLVEISFTKYSKVERSYSNGVGIIEESHSTRLNMTKMLVDKYLALEWNPFYTRPAAAHNLSRFMALLLKSSERDLKNGELPQGIKTREEKRAKEYLRTVGGNQCPPQCNIKINIPTGSEI